MKGTMRDVVRFWYGFSIAEDGDRLYMLLMGVPVYVITCQTPTQKRQAIHLYCAVADGKIKHAHAK